MSERVGLSKWYVLEIALYIPTDRAHLYNFTSDDEWYHDY